MIIIEEEIHMWYKNNYKRSLIDMHIHDWKPEFLNKFDGEAYADAICAAGVDTAILYSSNCLGLCYWPTKVGKMHASINGRDIFGETVEACRKRGLKVVGYYNIWNRAEFDRHPEWRIYDINGKSPTVDYGGRYGLCCMNTGYYDFVEKQITDLCSNYKLDGLWIDMIGWHGKICYCDSCKKKYLSETGLILPTEVDFSNSEWNRFIRKRQEWCADFAEMITNTAKKIQPGISVVHQFSTSLHGWKGGSSLKFLEQNDYLAGDFYMKPWEESFICKLLRSLSKNPPIEFMVPVCPDLSQHTTIKSIDTLTLQMYMAVSHLSAFVTIDAINPDGTVNKPLYHELNSVFEKMTPYADYIGKKWNQIADVALYINPDNQMDLLDCNPNNDKTIDFIQKTDVYETSKSFIDANIAFDVITPYQLCDISKYKTIVLTEGNFILTNKEIEAFKRYVANGGNLFISGRAGLVNENGDKNSDFALSEIMGVHYIGDADWNISYMSPKKEAKDVFSYYREDYPLSVSGRQTKIALDDNVTVLATRADTIDNPKEINRFSSAISNPPYIFTDEPSLTMNNYKKGKVLYSCGAIESAKNHSPKVVFSNIINKLIENPTIKTNAPTPVHVNLFADEENEKYLLNILNFQEQLPVIPVYDMEVWINTNGRTISSAVYVSDKRPCKFEEKDNGYVFYIDKLDQFEMIEIF